MKRFDDKIYVGIVEDISDPDKLGRIKVRVQGIFDEIPVEDIPWARPFKSLDGKSFNLPLIGKLVNVMFFNNNIYEPTYIYSENYNINLEDVLKDYSDEEYENFVALLFDHKTQIYSDDKIELKDNQQKINIGTKDSSQQAMLGNHWLEWFDTLVQTLQKPTSLMGNLAAPVIRPEVDAILSEYWTKRETFISDHVYITDDLKIKKLE